MFDLNKPQFLNNVHTDDKKQRLEKKFYYMFTNDRKGK